MTLATETTGIATYCGGKECEWGRLGVRKGVVRG